MVKKDFVVVTNCTLCPSQNGLYKKMLCPIQINFVLQILQNNCVTFTKNV